MFHYISRTHLQRYLDELVFRRNQREIILREAKDGAPGGMELRYRKYELQVGDLLARAVGRQVRRSAIGGIDWPAPIAAGFRPAPSVS